MRAEVTAVSCPACGVGLQALGGGRVVLQVCSHCGSELDAVEGYRLLRRHTEVKRPATPFALGARGRIAGIDWTVIGVLGWSETHAGQSWGWVDHQLFSPTHGYAWLTLEDGHLLFTRAWRGARHPVWITPDQVEAAEHRPSLHARGRSHAYYETSDASVTSAEGEFSSAVRRGDRVRALTFLAEDGMLTLSRSGHEQEVELTTWLPQAETWAAFGLTPPGPSWRIHPLQPFQPWAEERFLSRLGLGTLAAALVLGVALVGQGTPVATQRLPGGTVQAFELDLPLTQTRGLTELTLVTDLHNAWSGIELALTDPQGAPVFQTATELGYYEGIEAGERWSEGSSRQTLAFRPAVAGTYGLEVEVAEGGRGEGAGGSPIGFLQVQVTEGAAASFWMWLAAALALPFAALTPVRRRLHHLARWRGSDWSDA